MKAKVLRICSAICILAIMGVFFFAPWITVDSDTRKELKEKRIEISDNIEKLEDDLIALLESYDDDIEEVLGDYDLPDSKKDLQRTLKSTKSFVNNLLDGSLSPFDIFFACIKAPQFISLAENLVDAADEIDNSINENFSVGMLDDYSDMLSAVKSFFMVIIAIFVVAILLGILAVIFTAIGKAAILRYLYLIPTMMVSLLFAAIGLLLDLLFTGEDLLSFFSVSAVPFIVFILCIVPMVLDGVIKSINKKEAAKAVMTSAPVAEPVFIDNSIVITDDAPVAEEVPVAEETPVAEEAPVVEETPVVEAAPAPKALVAAFCTNCGAKLTGGKFCGNCGTKIE